MCGFLEQASQAVQGHSGAGGRPQARDHPRNGPEEWEIGFYTHREGQSLQNSVHASGLLEHRPLGPAVPHHTSEHKPKLKQHSKHHEQTTDTNRRQTPYVER